MIELEVTMSKQSSIDWLVEQIKKDINLRLRGFDIDKALEQAKAMHNKEIVDAHVNGNKEYTIGGGYELIAEHYYNETFGGNNE